MRHRSLSLVFASFPFMALAACSDGKQGPPVDPFEHVKVPVHCTQNVPGTELYPNGPNPDELLMNFRPVGLGSKSAVNAGLVSHDAGHTWAKIFSDSQLADQIPALDRAIGSVHDPIFVGDDFYVPQRVSTLCPIPGELPLTIVLDGTGHDTCPVASNAALAPGVNAELLYKGDATRWLARTGGLLYASRDAGVTWTLVGPAPDWPYQGYTFHPLAFHGDRALFAAREQDPSLTVLQIAGQEPRTITWKSNRYQATPIESGAFWGDAIVVTDFGEVLATTDLGVSFFDLGTPLDALELNLRTDAKGRLWGLPSTYTCLPEHTCSPSGYRWDPGATTPVKIDLDFGGLPADGVANFFDSSEGRFRMLVRSSGAQVEALRTLICEAGDGVTAGWEPITPQPISAAAKSTGVVRVARFDSGTEQQGRMAITPSGRIYAIAGEQARLTAGPPSWPFLFGYTQEDPDKPGRYAAAPFAATETTIDFALDTADTSAVPFPPHLLGHYSTQEEASPLATEEFPLEWRIFNVREMPGAQLLQTTSRTWRRDRLTAPPGGLRPPSWENNVVVDNVHGAWIGGIRYDSQGIENETEYVVRFDPRREPVPDRVGVTATCYKTVPTPPECIPLVNAVTTDAAFDTEGNLYVLDANHGSVLELPAGASAFEPVATGFVRPNDLAIRYVDGKPVVLVFDGDVLAFAPEAGKTKTRLPDPAPDYTIVFGERDVRGCLRDGGPCLTTPATNDGTLDLTSGAGCVEGAHLGASGKVIADGVEVTTSSWSDSKVCFTLPAGARSGLVHVIAGGVPSNRIGYAAKATVEEWPANPILAGHVARITGTNLEQVEVVGLVREIGRGDTFIDVQASVSGGIEIRQLGVSIGTHPVTVAPEVLRGCTVAPGEPCTLVGQGFGPAGTLTVDGQPVTPFAWSENMITFYAPGALATGTHAIEVKAAVAMSAKATLEVPAIAPEVMATHHNAGALNPVYGWPAMTTAPDGSRHVLASVDSPNYTTVDGVETPSGSLPTILGSGWERRDSIVPSFDQPVFGSAPGPLASFGADAVYVDGATVGKLVSTGKRIPEAPVVQTPLATLTVPPNAGPAGIGEIAGRIVVIEGHVDNATTLYDVPADGSPSPIAPAATVPITTLAGPKPIVSATGVYLGTCGATNAPAKVVFVPVTGAGPLVFGAPETLLDDPSSVVVACTATPDGFAFVARDGGGVERAFRHTVASGVTLIAPLPANVPAGDVAMMPVLRDMAQAPSGDLVLLVDDPAAGLRLFRLSAAGVATAASPVAASTIARPGELCIGPSGAKACGSDFAGEGCGPVACPFRPWQLFARPEDTFGLARIVPGTVTTTAEVVYEARTIVRSEVHLGGSADIHRVTLPVP